MADNGIRTTNLPRGSVIEVLGHSDAGNGLPGAIVRQALDDFIQALLAKAGLDPSGIADISQRLAAEILARQQGDAALGGRIDAASALITILQSMAQAFDATIDGDQVPLALIDPNNRAALWVAQDGRVVIGSHRGLTQDGVDIPETSDPRWLYAYADGGGAIAQGVRATGDAWDTRSLASPFAERSHIIVISQSNGVAVEAFPQIAAAVSKWGGQQFLRGQMTWLSDSTAQQPWIRTESGMEVVDLAPNPPGELHGAGETVAFGLCDGLKARISGRYTPNPQARTFPRFLWSNACEGGRYLTEVGPEDSSTRPENNGNRGVGGYYKNTLDDIRFARADAADRAWSYAVAFLLWMQGEAERGTMSLYPFQAAMTPTALIAGYRDKLIGTHEQFNVDQAALSGNAARVPMFTYQTCDPFIGEAQRQAAIQGRDIYMVSGTYFMPSALNSVIGTGSAQTYGTAIHMAADAQRWFAEMVAKVAHRVLVKGEGHRPLQPVRCLQVDARTIDIEFHVPAGHLVLDTTFLATARGFGFQVWSATVNERYAGTATQIAVTAATVLTANRLRLTLATDMIGGTSYHVVYANEYGCDLGLTPTIASTRAGPATANGFATTELVLTADISTALAPLVAEGAFTVSKGAIQAPIRTVYVDAGKTVLRYETREISGGSAFTTGAVDAVGRPCSFGNLRDTDGAVSLYGWSAAPYGSRTGAYPMWNWCAFFDNLTVS